MNRSLVPLAVLLVTIVRPLHGQDTVIHPFGGFFLGGNSLSRLPSQSFPDLEGNFGIRGSDSMFGLTLGRSVLQSLAIEGSAGVSPAGKSGPVLFANPGTGGVSEYVHAQGGNSLFFDGGVKWSFPMRTKITPFVSGRVGMAIRSAAMSREQLDTLSTMARLRGDVLRVGPIGRQTNGFVRLGFGVEYRASHRWSLRIEARDRIEPNVLPESPRHFLEVTAGPSFRF